MGTGNFAKTDLFALHGIVQQTMLSYSKELFIEILREAFSQDSYFHYVRDEWGYPKLPDHTDLDPEAGLNDDVTGRLFIGEPYRYGMKYFPAIFVKGGSFKSVPISMSRDQGYIIYGTTVVVDGYGNERTYRTPSHFELAGAWEGSIIIDIAAGDSAARDELLDIISIMLVTTHFDSFKNSGVVIKPPNIGNMTETDDVKDKIYKASITCDVRTEWRQQIQIDSVVDAISFCIDFGNLLVEPEAIAPNIRVNSLIEFIETL